MKNRKYLESKPLSVLLFLFLFLMYAVVYMTKNMFSSAMATIVEEGVMTKSQTGLINAVFWLVYAPFQIIGGLAVDKHSPHKLIMIGLAGAVISNVIIYFNQSYTIMMVAWTFNAIAQFGLWPGVFTIVSTQLAPGTRGTAAFWLLFSTSVGLGLSMLVASFVSHWKQNFLISVISLLIMMVIYAVLNHFMDKKMIKHQIPANYNNRNDKDSKTPLLPLMLSSGLIVFMLLSVFRGAVDNGIKMMTPVMLMESYNELPAAASTRMSSVLIIFSAFGTLIAGLVRRKITKNEAKAQVIFYTISALPLVAVCFIGHISYIWILVSLSFAVMFLQGASPFCQSFVSIRFEKYGRIGTVAGILNATSSIGNILASYIFAKMAEVIPWMGVTSSWLALILICAVLCVLIFPRWKRFLKK